MELTEQVARFIDARGLAEFDYDGVTGNVFLQTSPANPHESWAIYSTGGPPGDRTKIYNRATIQVVIRTIPGDPRKGEGQARELVEALNGFNSAFLTEGGNYIVDTEALQSAPNNIGQDESGRYEFSQNFIFEYKL